MPDNVMGLHHITAIAGNAQRNYDFYTKVLGLRLVKKTVNFDDPGTYHFYFGDQVGSPGSILTFFPWEGIRKGSIGAGMASEIVYTVPADSLQFWADRFQKYNVKHSAIVERFGEQYLPFEDPDGLMLSLAASTAVNDRKPWPTEEVKESVATKGFHSVALTLRAPSPTAKILTEVLGYKALDREDNRYRFMTDAVTTANIIDILEEPAAERGINAGGTTHHIAFRVKDEETLMVFRTKVINAGLTITEKIDRNYFYSLYFREPGGVLFEIATDNPGFATDEKETELGTHLMLPAQYESQRIRIEESLPKLLQ